VTMTDTPTNAGLLAAAGEERGGAAAEPQQRTRLAKASDAVTSPPHYRGRSGLQSIEITHAYRLGPDLTQAVDYILRAGKKTVDPRQDLAKAAFYLRYAASLPGDRVFGLPGNKPLPDADAIAADFDLDGNRRSALYFALTPMPSREDCIAAAEWCDYAAFAWQRRLSLATDVAAAHESFAP